MTQTGYLSDRKVIAISGPDTHEFLQRVITTDMALIKTDTIMPGALLTPQGKIICDFFIHGTSDGVMIDVWSDAAESLTKRLTLYRLRADAEISLRDDLVVQTGEGQTDPRSGKLPKRQIVSRGDDPDMAADQMAIEIANGVPTFGRDYGEAEVFPTDVNLDLYGGIGWKKGCFIGQEVLSRMKRRGTIRKRSISVSFDETAPAKGTQLLAGETPVGEITSSHSHTAIARIRTDRLEAAGSPITANGKIANPEQVPE